MIRLSSLKTKATGRVRIVAAALDAATVAATLLAPTPAKAWWQVVGAGEARLW